MKKKIFICLTILLLLTGCNYGEKTVEVNKIEYKCEKFGISMMVDEEFIITDPMFENRLEIIGSDRLHVNMFFTKSDTGLSKFTKSYLSDIITGSLSEISNGFEYKIVKVTNYVMEENCVRISYVTYNKTPMIPNTATESEYNNFVTYYIYKVDNDKFLCVTLSEPSEFIECENIQQMINSVKVIGITGTDIEVYNLDSLFNNEYSLIYGFVGSTPGPHDKVKYR